MLLNGMKRRCVASCCVALAITMGATFAAGFPLLRVGRPLTVCRGLSGFGVLSPILGHGSTSGGRIKALALGVADNAWRHGCGLPLKKLGIGGFVGPLVEALVKKHLLSPPKSRYVVALGRCGHAALEASPPRPVAPRLLLWCKHLNRYFRRHHIY